MGRQKPELHPIWLMAAVFAIAALCALMPLAGATLTVATPKAYTAFQSFTATSPIVLGNNFTISCPTCGTGGGGTTYTAGSGIGISAANIITATANIPSGIYTTTDGTSLSIAPSSNNGLLVNSANQLYFAGYPQLVATNSVTVGNVAATTTFISYQPPGPGEYQLGCNIQATPNGYQGALFKIVLTFTAFNTNSQISTNPLITTFGTTTFAVQQSTASPVYCLPTTIWTNGFNSITVGLLTLPNPSFSTINAIAYIQRVG